MIPASRVIPKAISFHSVEKHYANSIDKAFKAGTTSRWARPTKSSIL